MCQSAKCLSHPKVRLYQVSDVRQTLSLWMLKDKLETGTHSQLLFEKNDSQTFVTASVYCISNDSIFIMKQEICVTKMQMANLKNI